MNHTLLKEALYLSEAIAQLSEKLDGIKAVQKLVKENDDIYFSLDIMSKEGDCAFHAQLSSIFFEDRQTAMTFLAILEMQTEAELEKAEKEFGEL